MKKLKVHLYVNIAMAFAFTLLCLSFHDDVSLLAFPLSLVFTAVLSYIVLKVFLQKNDASRIGIIRRIFQYEPFVYISAFVIQRCGKQGMPFALDLAASLVWCAITVSSFLILFRLSEKRVYALSSEWEDYRRNNPPEKYKGVRKIGYEILDWLDAIIQAVFTIVLLNIFIFQLYVIPSESMVPAFLVKDRVVVFKTFAGPRFPLSDVGLPYVNKYRRGDIVVFRNPHYSDDRKNEIKSFLSQFVYMLTLTLVNTNVDESGLPKSDPLVKRLVGEPGEQLMLMDGKLYVRTKGEDFTEVRDYGMYDVASRKDLYDISDNTLKIAALPVTHIDAEDIAVKGNRKGSVSLVEAMQTEQYRYSQIIEVEGERRKLDLKAAAAECEDISAKFAVLAKGGSADESEVRSFFGNYGLRLPSYYISDHLNGASIFPAMSESALKLFVTAGGSQWMNHFMNDWHKNLGDLSLYTEEGAVTGSHLAGGDLYTDSLVRLNVMTKLCFGRLVLRSAELYSEGKSMDYARDPVIYDCLSQYEKLRFYIGFMDQRNMGIFPANSEDGEPVYIPEHCYFMAGDNRYNSLDMRHSMEIHTEVLDKNDAYSVMYASNLVPQYVHRKKILGKASLRFWPFSRFGIPSIEN